MTYFQFVIVFSINFPFCHLLKKIVFDLICRDDHFWQKYLGTISQVLFQFLKDIAKDVNKQNLATQNLNSKQENINYMAEEHFNVTQEHDVKMEMYIQLARYSTIGGHDIKK